MSAASRSSGVLRAAIPPAVLGIGFLVAWQVWVEVYDVQPFVVPKPTAIWNSLVDNADLVWKASVVTGTNALVGLVLGATAGFVLAVLTNRFSIVAQLVDPLAVTIAAIPAVVIVGVLNNMYALDSQIGRRIMVSLAVFFIVFVQVAKGLRQNDATQMELLRSYAATPRQTLRKVRLPNTLPFFFTAVGTAAPVAVIIALVSEYFGGTQDGLGSKISGTLNGSNKALGFAYVVGGSIVGLLFFVGSGLLEYVVVPWKRRRISR
ncbi:MAG: ABC transporter permease [Ilumatobacteraceae bacterium]